MAENTPILEEFTVSQNFNAPRVNLKPGEYTSVKFYEKGKKFKGFLYENKPGVKPFVLEATGMYALPMYVLDRVNKPLPKPAIGTTNTLPKELQDRLNQIKNTDIVDGVIKKAQAGSKGLLYGSVAGLAYAVFKKKSIIPCVLIGGFGAAFVNYMFADSQSKTETQKPTV